VRGAVRARMAPALCAAALCATLSPALVGAQDEEALYRRAWSAMRQGRTAEAESILGAARKARPEDPRPYLGLGDLSFSRREYARSMQFYGKALTLSPSDVRVIVGLAKWSFFTGDLEGARRGLRAALDRIPGDPETRAFLTYLGVPVNWPKEVGQAARSQGITRGDMAGILAAHMADLKELRESPFTKVLTDIGTHWAKDAILNAVRKGWMASRSDHTFGPGEPFQRVQLAEVVYNVFQGAGVKVDDDFGARRPIDIGARHLSLRAVLFTLGRGLMRKTGRGDFFPLGSVSGFEAIEILERVKRLLFPLGLSRG